jgi:membrane-bound lytic murein transglycosylase D
MNKKLAWFIQVFLFCNTLFAQGVKSGTDELYQSRLSTIRSPIEIIYKAEVKKYIDAYLDNPEKTRHILQQSKIYFPIIERAFRNKGVTTDLKYLAVALSELEPDVQSQYGANGLWMMMYTVGKMYKAKVNSFVDERLDPFKSSLIAASHFRDLYSIYHQWPLVIASYAASPVVLNKSIRMSGNSLYFWDVYPNIPETTRDIYPRFVAAVYIMNFYREHGIRPVLSDPPLATDSVLVNKWLSLQQISATLDISLEALRKLNPIFKRDIIPYNLDGYWVYLPAGKAEVFDRLRDTVYNPLPRPVDFTPVAIAKEAPDSNTIQTEANTKSGNSEPISQPQKFDKKKVSYTVKKGDNLNQIADWYDVTTSEIKSWNKLKKSKLQKGKKLTIWVNEKKTGYYKRINSMSVQQKKKLLKKD